MCMCVRDVQVMIMKRASHCHALTPHTHATVTHAILTLLLTLPYRHTHTSLQSQLHIPSFTLLHLHENTPYLSPSNTRTHRVFPMPKLRHVVILTLYSFLLVLPDIKHIPHHHSASLTLLLIFVI